METPYSTSRINLFEVIHMFVTHHKVNLSRAEAAALVASWGCKVGASARPQVDCHKLLVRMSLLSEHARTESRATQLQEMQDLKKRDETLRDKYTLQLDEVHAEDTAQMEAYRAATRAAYRIRAPR